MSVSLKQQAHHSPSDKKKTDDEASIFITIVENRCGEYIYMCHVIF